VAASCGTASRTAEKKAEKLGQDVLREEIWRIGFECRLTECA